MQDVLKISSDSSHPERHIAEAIKGIRSAMGDAKARTILATPKYLVVPPTASAMRAFIGPKKVITRTEIVNNLTKTRNIMCIGTRLVGNKLSGKEKKKWREGYALSRSNYVGDFKGHLSSSFMELAPFKGWMRMRVHFGHLVFKRFPSEYAASQKSLDQFDKMLGFPHIRGKIERV
jgi:hypothetical protein